MYADSEILIRVRSRMMSIAYRMLGSVAEAEDVVQDAFLRFQTATDVLSPEGFLIRVTTRLCIDRLRAARRRDYPGPWVPEPIQTEDASHTPALAESLTQAFLLMLERLSPDERAAFLLRTVFDYEYAEIAEVVGKTETYVRQIVSRAKQHLGQSQPRFRPSLSEAPGLAERFISACRVGNVHEIETMFTNDVAVHSDGGGKATAARVVIHGRDRAARFLVGVFRKRLRSCELHTTTVNGEPGVAFVSSQKIVMVISLDIEREIKAIYMTLNPDKLTRWSQVQVE